MNKKLNFIFRNKTKYKIFLYLLVFIIIIFFVYLFVPKLFNYTPELVKESLKKNSNININNISNINYKFFPTPRLRLSGTNLKFEENTLEVNGAEVDIILNPLSIINYKILDYNKFLIKGGSTNIKINELIYFFNYITNNKKKIIFEKNNIILLKKNKILFEIKNSSINIKNRNDIQNLKINGLFLNSKTSLFLENSINNKVKIIMKIPELDISTNIFLEKKDNLKILEGVVNLEILNNFFQFNITKKNNIQINKGIIRSNFLNSSLDGNLSFKPYFKFNLDVELSSLNVKKLIPTIQKIFSFENPNEFEILKKIDGSLNFKNMFKGNIVFKNREIFLKNFKIGKNNSIFFDAKINKYGKKRKIQFNLLTNIKNKINIAMPLEITGHITPFYSKINFEKIVFDDEILTQEKLKNYENSFNNKIINGSLDNIFNEKKINNFFKTF